jgi:hypothetical protein
VMYGLPRRLDEVGKGFIAQRRPDARRFRACRRLHADVGASRAARCTVPAGSGTAIRFVIGRFLIPSSLTRTLLRREHRGDRTRSVQRRIFARRPAAASVALSWAGREFGAKPVCELGCSDGPGLDRASCRNLNGVRRQFRTTRGNHCESQ